MPHKRKHSLERIFNTIIAFKKANDGASPVIRQLCKSCDVSSTSVMNYALGSLEKDGLIKRLRRTGRNKTVISVIGARWLSPTEAAEYARFEAWLEEQRL